MVDGSVDAHSLIMIEETAKLWRRLDATAIRVQTASREAVPAR